VRDAYINSSWSTVALGAMRHGGKLFYALDLGSDPEQEPNVLWEFTDNDDSDMGFSYAGGQIGHVVYPTSPTTFASKWVAFIPNGYNSTNQKSVLYAIDLESGQVLHKWNTGLGSDASPNGMGPPVLSDFVAYNSTVSGVETVIGGDQSVEFVYAGDLYGNVYRFDTSDIFTGNDTIEKLFSGDTARPITTAPRVFSLHEGSESATITFGTGKYLELPDRGILGVGPQYLFGLRDTKNPITNSYSLNDSRLVEQFIAESSDTRQFSANPVTDEQGWKMELPTTGERMVNDLGRDGKARLLFVATIIPNGENPCLPGGTSWLMVLDASTGKSPVSGQFFGTNRDGVLIQDIVTGLNVLTTIGGNQTIISIDGTGSGSGSGGSSTDLPPIILDSGEKWRRRSWHRIIFD